MSKRQITVMIVGYGDRGHAYTKYALTHPEHMKVVAAVEPDEARREEACRTFSIPRERCFSCLEEALSQGRIADAVINATMDSLHVETALPLLRQGYDMLLEKPVTSVREELLTLKKTADEHGCKLMICHVLRYTPFYRRIKEILLSGEIGKIFFIDTSEMVGVAHASASYIRGKWNKRTECGSSMLLAKCCHDLDLLCWFMSGTTPESVASLGGREFFVPENAPERAGTRCLVDCPLERDCMYSCRKLNLENDYFGQYIFAELTKGGKQISQEQKYEYLRDSAPFGECIWKTGADIVDRQALVLRFSDGTVAVHGMVSGVARPGRKVHIVGSKGEIDGFLEDNKFTVRLYRADNCLYTQREEVITGVEEGDGHSGGDSRIAEDFANLVAGEPRSVSATVIEDSLNGHFAVYAADESMETGRVVPVRADEGGAGSHE